MIDITGLDPAEVLCALYNAARPQGMGFLHYDPQPMTHEQADKLLVDNPYFDYLKGRVMKIQITNPLDVRLYDRDNGQGSGETIILALRLGLEKETTSLIHDSGKKAAAREAKVAMNIPTGLTDENTFYIGLSDVAEPLGKAIDQALQKEDK